MAGERYGMCESALTHPFIAASRRGVLSIALYFLLGSF
jgi:hypothetical protein